ncbi:MAG: sodium:calcium antiporter [Deltaproteobacteria bacterium]
MTTALLLFLVSVTAVVIAGTVLTRAADLIAERTGLGRVWIGVILVATATSLPELATDISAVRLGAPNLGAGDLFGSSMANMLILALLGLVPPRDLVFQRAALDHALSASLAIILTALAAALILAPTGLAVLGMGPESLILLAVFVAGTLTVYRQGRRTPAAPGGAASRTPQGPSLKSAVIRFGIAAVVVVAVSPVFAYSAERIAELTGLGQTFIGTLLVGLSTSLPELVTAFAAARIGAFDLAVGNLFGSNAFNMVVFLPMELAHRGGPLFLLLDPSHALTAFFAIVLMALGLAAIMYRAERRHALVEPGSVLMVICYLLALWALYDHARR